jgi:hypothetical protein
MTSKRKGKTENGFGLIDKSLVFVGFVLIIYAYLLFTQVSLRDPSYAFFKLISVALIFCIGIGIMFSERRLFFFMGLLYLILDILTNVLVLLNQNFFNIVLVVDMLCVVILSVKLLSKKT